MGTFAQLTPEELFVETILALALLIRCGRPESAAVRCEDLVDQNHLIRLFVETKLKFGISDYDSFRQGIISGLSVDFQAEILNLFCIFLSNNACGYNGLANPIVVIPTSCYLPSSGWMFSSFPPTSALVAKSGQHLPLQKAPIVHMLVNGSTYKGCRLAFLAFHSQPTSFLQVPQRACRGPSPL